MNVITFEKAYCLFPRATLDEYFSLVCTSRQDDVIEAIYQKYTARGWNIIRSVDDIDHVTTDPALNMNQRRWIDDRFAWSIDLPLPPTFKKSLVSLNERTKAIGRDPASVTTWRQTISEDQHTCEMVFNHCQSINLFYGYIFSGYAVMVREPINSLLELTSAHNAGCRANALYSRH